MDKSYGFFFSGKVARALWGIHNPHEELFSCAPRLPETSWNEMDDESKHRLLLFMKPAPESNPYWEKWFSQKQREVQ